MNQIIVSIKNIIKVIIVPNCYLQMASYNLDVSEQELPKLVLSVAEGTRANALHLEISPILARACSVHPPRIYFLAPCGRGLW
jgi:hypothetical protein